MHASTRTNVEAAAPKRVQKEPKNDPVGTQKANCIVSNELEDEIESSYRKPLQFQHACGCMCMHAQVKGHRRRKWHQITFWDLKQA